MNDLMNQQNTVPTPGETNTNEVSQTETNEAEANEDSNAFEIKSRAALITALEYAAIQDQVILVEWPGEDKSELLYLVPDTSDNGDNHIVFELPSTDAVISTANAEEFIFTAVQKQVAMSMRGRIQDDGSVSEIAIDDLLPVKPRGMEVWKEQVQSFVKWLQQANIPGINGRSLRAALESKEYAETKFTMLPDTVWTDNIIPKLKNHLGDSCPIFDNWVKNRDKTKAEIKTKAIDMDVLANF